MLHARFDSAAGEGVTNAYDGLGRLESQSSNMGGAARTLAHQYDRASNRTRIAYPDGTFFDLPYDGLNRLERILGGGEQLIAQAYEPWGPRSTIGRIGSGSVTNVTDGRVIGLSHYLPPGGSPPAVQWSFEHNPAGQVASATMSNDAWAWTGHYAVDRPYAADGLNRYESAGGAQFTTTPTAT